MKPQYRPTLRKTFRTIMGVLALIFTLANCAPPAGQAPVQPAAPAESGSGQATGSEFANPTPKDPGNIVTELRKLTANPPSPFDRIQPPKQRLTELSGIFNKRQNELLTPIEIKGEMFNSDNATTYVLPNGGALFQLVSFVNSANEELQLDDWLTKSKEWGTKALVLGGLLVYQDFSVENTPLPKGTYAVLLRRKDGGTPQYEIWDQATTEPVITGEWRLRRLGGPADAPFSFVSENQLCFSQLTFQGCLQFTPPDVPQSAEKAEQARQKLVDNKLLPGNIPIHSPSAFASATGYDIVKNCNEALDSEKGESCKPSYATAALSTVVAESDQPLKGSFGVAVLEVLAEINGPIVDDAGKQKPLPPGSYRLDVFVIDEGMNLGQLIGTDSKTFYILLRNIFVLGVAVNLDDPEKPIDEELPEGFVLFDPTVYSYCSLYGTYLDPPCKPPKKRKVIEICWLGC